MLEKFLKAEPDHKEYSESDYSDEFNKVQPPVTTQPSVVNTYQGSTPIGTPEPKDKMGRPKSYLFSILSFSVLVLGILVQMIIGPAIKPDSDPGAIFEPFILSIIIGSMGAIIAFILAVIAIFRNKVIAAPVTLIILSVLTVAIEITILAFAPMYFYMISDVIREAQ